MADPATNRLAPAATIDWFRANEAWWRAARSGEWDAYYERQYAGRIANAERASVAPGDPADGIGA